MLAWRARHNPPPEIVSEDDLRRWKLAVWCAQALQLTSVISTQRITPENVVAESLNDLQRLVDRSSDSRNLAVLKANNARERAAKQQERLKSGTAAKAVSLRQLKKARKPLDESSYDNQQTAESGRKGRKTSPREGTVNKEMTESRVKEALDFGQKNAFLTRRTWHKNVGHHDPHEQVPQGERYSSGVSVTPRDDK